ncbi:hypothetical protein FI667_g1362, partial [Globisporangium splendens]
MKAFTHALRIRGDHVIALLNYLQLSIAEMEYKTALDCILRILELISTQSDSHTYACNGLLDTDRSVQAMSPAMSALLADEELSKCGVQMLQLLKEYRGLLSPHIQSNTTHIFQKQSALAHLVEEICQILRQREAAVAKAKTGDNEAGKDLDVLDLDELNRILDEYTSSIVVQHQDHDRVENNTDEISNQEFHSVFLAELAQVCDRVAQSLPAEVQVPSPAQRPARLDLGNLDSLGGSGATIDNRALSPTKRNSPRSPSAAAASRKRSSIVTTGVHRPIAAPLSAYPSRMSTINSSLTAASAAAAASAAQSTQAVSTLVKSTKDMDSSLLPQRSQSGPTGLTNSKLRANLKTDT